MIPLTRPYLPANTLKKIAAVLTSGHLTEGPVTRQLEEAFAAFTGATEAVAVTSCTTGMELVLRALGIGAGDEVVVPDYTYPATAQAVMLTGATAVLVDCDPATLNVDYGAMEAAITPRTKALMPVSLFGNPLDWPRLEALARRHNLPVIEDAACGLGSAQGGKRTGSRGLAAIFSLHPRKSITTGEGGMITTSDPALARRLRSLKRFGLESLDGERETLRFAHLGTNLKMGDVAAAMGLAQMEEIDPILARRSELAARYRQLLQRAETEGLLRWPAMPPQSVHGWQSCCICTPHRNQVLQALRAEGIEVQIGTYALHREPLFHTHPLCRLDNASTTGMPGSLRCFEETLALPLFHMMTETQQNQVAERLMALLTASFSKTR